MLAHPQNLDRRSALPIYEQLAQRIATSIGAGQLSSGERLPTELEMARDNAISRDTVRQALEILERRGLVVRRRPKGTFVAPARVSQDLAELRSFHGGLLARGMVPRMELLDFRPVKTPAQFAAVFPHPEVMRLLRRYVVDGKPLAVAEIHLHPMTRAIAWDIAEHHNTYEIFERFLNVRVARAWATIRADAAGRSTAPLLDLCASAAVLVLMQTHYAESDAVLLCSSLRVRSDAYEFQIDLPNGLALHDGLANAVATDTPRTQA